MPRRREALALAALTAFALALRLWHIGSQSYWYDESYTVDLVGRSLGGMLSAIPHTESTPPLYYLLAWVWAKVFGTGEAALRSLSALIGAAAVPFAWGAARDLFRSPRAGWIAAALVAVNPYLVWYSQEARSYSLLVLMTAVSLLFLARRQVGLWAVAAVLALLTHYFAGFVVVAEAAWLLYATRTRAAAIATGVVGLAGAALMPLALHQRASQSTAFIAQLGLGRRVEDLPKKLVTGELGTFTPLIGPLAGIVAAAAVAYALFRARRTTLGLLWLVAFGAGVPLLFALAGADYLLPRNVIAVYVPLALAVAGGLAAARRLGVAGAAVICAVALVVDVQVTRDDRLQRTDWRDAATALGPAPEAIVVTPAWDEKALRLYAGRLAPMPAAGAPVSAVVLIGEGQPPLFGDPPPPHRELPDAPLRRRRAGADLACHPCREQARPQAALLPPAKGQPVTRIIALPGDGIGPEIMAAARELLDRIDGDFEIEERLVGGASIDASGSPLTDEVLEDCRKADAVLLAAVGGPKWDTTDPDAPRPEQGLLGLRKGLGLYANLRPVRPSPALLDASPLKRDRIEGTDLLVVRELTGGVYFGDRGRRDGSAYDTTVYSETEIERIAEVGFRFARERVTSVDKANILETSRLWREVVERVAKRHPDKQLDHLLVDNAAMQLVSRPSSFDVILTENMFGDILSDEAAMLTGSIGMLPSASVGEPGTPGLFEPVHGSAPDIAGSGKANPLAMFGSVAMMLRYGLGRQDEATAVESAVDRALAGGLRTADLGGDATLEDATRAVLTNL